MLLAIDAGNTNVEFALFEGKHIIAQWRTESVKKTNDEWFSWLKELTEVAGIDAAKISGIIISCVVPDMLDDLVGLAIRHLGHKPQIIGDRSLDLGLEVEVGNPDEVGADLLAGAVAAKQFYGAPALILDMGTATTLTLVNNGGNFEGVAIAPGLELSSKALTDGAAKLPQVKWQKTEKVIGTTTTTAIQGGLFWGYLGLVENLIKQATQQFLAEYPDAPLKVVATGGLATKIVEHTNLVDEYEPDLILKGLQYIYERNHEQIMKKLSQVS